MIEFVSVGVLLMVPVAYFVLVLGRVQAASFAAAGAAREAARAFVTAGNDSEGRQRAATVTELVLADHGFPAGDGDLEIRCAAAVCLAPGESVTVEVRVRASAPWLPSGLARGIRAGVEVAAQQTETVDEFRAADG